MECASLCVCTRMYEESGHMATHVYNIFSIYNMNMYILIYSSIHPLEFFQCQMRALPWPWPFENVRTGKRDFVSARAREIGVWNANGESI